MVSTNALPTFRWEALTSDRADPKYIAEAVLHVYAKYSVEDRLPGGDRYAYETAGRRGAMISDVRHEWLAIIGKDKTVPWHDDFICEAWVAWRKVSSSRKIAIYNYLGITFVPGRDADDESDHDEED